MTGLGVVRGMKRVLTFPQMIKYDHSCSIKLLPSEIEKDVSSKYGAISHGRAYHLLRRVKTSQLMQLLRLHRTNICESSNKMF